MAKNMQIPRTHDWTRRQFLTAGLLSAGAFLVPPVVLRAGEQGGVARARRELWAMGGWNYLEATGKSANATRIALDAMANTIREVDQLLSVFDTRTPLSQLNSSRTLSIAIDNPLVLTSVASALRCAQQFDGVFDPTIEPLMRRWGFRDEEGYGPHGSVLASRDWDYRMVECDLSNARIMKKATSIQLDSGGWAKGLAAERAVRAAITAGASLAQASCGGDIFRMDVLNASEWECAIRDPLRGRSDCALRVRHLYPTVATSGNFETYRTTSTGQRIGHLMDPRTGEPTNTDLLAVSVFGDDGLIVDAASSALFVMGKRAARHWLNDHPQFGAVMIDRRWPESGEGITVIGALEVV